MNAADAAVCVADVERLAGDLLPPDIRDFVAGGGGDESAQAANRACLDRVRLVPRVLTSADGADTAGRLLHGTAAMPVAVAPMAYQRLCHPDGELAMARAAGKAGVPFTAATLSSVPIEEIAAVAGTLWFQLYWLRDRGLVLDLLARAERAGCTALVLTVDVPVPARRPRDMRNGFTLPASVVAANLPEGTGSAAHVPMPHESAVASHTGIMFENTLGWDDLAWLRGHTGLPVVLKGVLDPGDAVRAVEAGVSAVVVSNHGGRQLAGAVPSIVALPGVVEAVAGRCEVLFDSGVRSGTDVLRALAYGAAGVLLGRPLLWGLAMDGEAGAGLVLDLLRAELREAMLLTGCADLSAARTLGTVLL
ncbi:alpha-hydroxy acid oxidase [Streptosporangium jomthongense]|uniref:Alpha-hydroxy acid oxidase n=1 Tax=Streptosporangium jomthongense TaxID=1193683 RepID=A0ABV8F5A7_9ACTN